jgi:hypothetical protein
MGKILGGTLPSVRIRTRCFLTGPVILCLAALPGFLAFTTQLEGATNRWTKSTSGNWEEPFWSLGELPSMAHDAIVFDNPGFKALAIGPSTTANYPASLAIRNLIVYDAPNLLLLNYSGLSVPLNVASDLVLSNGAALLSYSAALNAGTFDINGRATFAEQSRATFGTNRIGGAAPGELIISNAVVSSGSMFIGGGATGFVNHVNGSNIVTDYMLIYQNGAYNLSSGTFKARTIEAPYNTSRFTLSGGVAEVTEGMAFGEFLMTGGTLRTGAAYCRWGSRFAQTGGNHITSILRFPTQDNGYGEYVLSGGNLISSNVTVAGGLGAFGLFQQTGGQHTNGLLRLWGYDRTSTHHHSGRYALDGGLLVSESIDLPGGLFAQNGGTNLAGLVDLHSTALFALTNGVLHSSNVVLSSSPFFGGFRSIFAQYGGRQRVDNDLRINSGSKFYLQGGTLSVSNINVGASILVDSSDPYRWFTDDGLNLSGGLLTNSGILTLQGGAVLRAIGTTYQLGKLHLPGGRAVLDMGNGQTILRFLYTRDLPLGPQPASLAILNWSGSTNGGGTDQLIFGTNSQSMSPANLSQLFFVDPAGFPPGDYPARILDTGEVVPHAQPSVGYARSPNGLVVSWTGNYDLLTSTNLSGPFAPISSATSPYTNSFTGPQRYFLLRSRNP